MSILLINDLINEHRGRKRDILKRLKELNWTAFNYITNGGPYKANYYKLMRTDTWKEARGLLLEYHTVDGIIPCEICHKPAVKPLIHHLSYHFHELFSPSFLRVICSKHHVKGTRWSRQ